MATKSETEKTLIKVTDTPMPLNVVSAILYAVGAVYPAAKVKADGNVLHVVVPNGTLPREVHWEQIDWDEYRDEYPDDFDDDDDVTDI